MTGCKEFSDLVEHLIENGNDYIYPEVARTRSTDWMAHIRDHHDHGNKLATGQGATMEEACKGCVENYHECKRVEDRKQELLKIPEVQEALGLFRHSPMGLGGNYR